MDNGKSLTVTEQARLDELEVTIHDGLQTFVDVGTALAEIRDNRLYRQQYGTFEAYCQERWGLERRKAYRLMDAAGVVKNVSNWTQNLPENEAQARPLTKLEPKQQREAWSRAVETAPNGKVTGAHVEHVVKVMYERPAPPPPPVPVTPDLPQAKRVEKAPEPPSKMAVHFSSASAEHWTPDAIWKAARRCMGGEIDLDPCSNSKEMPNVPAAYHFTEDDDGLAQFWWGRVFMNPPYGRAIGEWVEKLCAEHEQGRVVAAVTLVPARTDTQWWGRLRDYPVCLVEGRLTFIGNNDPAPFPSAIFYLGDDIASFYHEFDEFGDIWQRVHPEMIGS